MPLELRVRCVDDKRVMPPPGCQVEEMTAWPADRWPIGVFHVVRRRRSVSPVEVEREGDAVTVRTFRGACAEDLQVAAAMVAAFGAPPDFDGTSLDPGALERQAHREAIELLDRVRATGSTLSLVGPFGQRWHVGPSHAARLATEKDPVRVLHERARRLLWARVDEEIFVAGTTFGGALLVQPDLPTLFRGARELLLERTDLRGEARIGPLRLAELLGSRMVWLDETNFIVEAVPRSQWDDLVEAART